jgi:hypothetical protein
VAHSDIQTIRATSHWRTIVRSRRVELNNINKKTTNQWFVSADVCPGPRLGNIQLTAFMFAAVSNGGE